jgi:hypothetical protein
MILKKTALNLFLTVLVLNLPLFTGCNGGNAGYEKATVTKGAITFSFECPKSLNDSNNSTQNTYIYKSIVLSETIDIRVDGRVHDKKLLSIRMQDFTNTIFDAKTEIDRSVYILTAGNFPVQQVKILERSNITISGISGEMLHFNAVFPEIKEYDNHLISSRSLSFVYGGYIWVIDYDTYEELESEASVEFEHIVNSFKFLE